MTGAAPGPGVAGLGTILGVWAHPDDEAYLMGGVAAMASAAGNRVACITATYGEGGESADARRWPRARLAEIRRAELAESLAILGVRDHRWLGHPDGGLAGVDSTNGVAAVLDAIERIRPDTVLTFGSDGMTSHPDHRTVSAWVTAAARRCARPLRVLAATKTEDWARRFTDVNAGIFPDWIPCTELQRLAIAVSLSDDVLARKVHALEAQASQTSGLIAAVGRERFTEWVREEFFVQVFP